MVMVVAARVMCFCVTQPVLPVKPPSCPLSLRAVAQASLSTMFDACHEAERIGFATPPAQTWDAQARAQVRRDGKEQAGRSQACKS